jgi:hypothetical protein
LSRLSSGPKSKTQLCRFLRSLNYSGLVEVEFKYDARDERYKILDVNARAWTWNALGSIAGVDFPHVLWQLAMGEAIEPIRSPRGGGGRFVDNDTAHSTRLNTGIGPSIPNRGDTSEGAADRLRFRPDRQAQGLGLQHESNRRSSADDHRDGGEGESSSIHLFSPGFRLTRLADRPHGCYWSINTKLPILGSTQVAHSGAVNRQSYSKRAGLGRGRSRHEICDAGGASALQCMSVGLVKDRLSRRIVVAISSMVAPKSSFRIEISDPQPSQLRFIWVRNHRIVFWCRVPQSMQIMSIPVLSNEL